MKFVRDRVFDRLISLEKGKVSSKISQLRKRHKVGQSLISLCIENNEDEWSVSSTRGKDIYIVRRNFTCSKECTLMCWECNHCLHNFTCTCIDNAVQWNMCKHIHFICSKNLNKNNSTILEEIPSLDSHVTDKEMIICEDRKVLEKEAHVDNLRATSTRTEISKEEFQKECMQLLNKVSPEQYNILTLLKNNVDSSHLFPEANQEIVSRSLNMEPPNKKIKTQRYVSTRKKTSQKTSTTLRKPTQEECQSVSTSLVLTAKSV
ncbi:uncharacterized protein TNCV_258161 [Trichonephila clavipes]|uniref:SWIM-type domain-containing protein n=1 Tax=Trichonephila clavipes TaxID=2585209 RepID=A0A8X6S3C4_TRICX|nr:uncharacterized protein TNCV_258161 [Trichonephila clavipes]